MNPFATEAMAEGYARARPPVHERVIAAAALDAVDRALDVGCGAGLSTRALRPLARRLYGIDPAGVMLPWARRTYPEASYACARAEALPYAAESLDLIAAAGSLNYADPAAFFVEARRALRPGGAVLVYDFAAGRRFADSPALGWWFDDFHRRYPPPVGDALPLDPHRLSSYAAGWRIDRAATLEVALPFAAAAYCEYALTETNVAAAAAHGADLAAIALWCEATLAPVFGGASRDVVFDAWFAVLR